MSRRSVLHLLNNFLPVLTGYTTRTYHTLVAMKGFADPTVLVPGPVSPAVKALLKEHPWGFLAPVGDVCRLPDNPLLGLTDKGHKLVVGLQMAAAARRLARERAIEVFHGHTPSYTSLTALRWAKSKGLPTVFEVRGLWEASNVVEGRWREGSVKYRAWEAAETSCMRAADRVVTLSEPLREEIERRGIEPRRITVIPNGVDTSAFMPAPRDPELEKKLRLRGRLVVGYAGTLRKMEGLEDLLRATPSLLRRRPEVRILIVGYGFHEAALRRLARDLGIAHAVRFTGRVPHPDMRRYYTLFDIFVTPRIRERVTEAVTPLKPLEAMAMERFVLVSDVGGLSALVRDGETGGLFKSGHVPDLADRILYYLDRDSERLRIARNARKWAVSDRDWKIICNRYREVYNI